VYFSKIKSTKTFPKVPGIDLCKSKGKNVVCEARINEAWRGSKRWLGFDGAYLMSDSEPVINKNKAHRKDKREHKYIIHLTKF
jgi:hypothetical protein